MNFHNLNLICAYLQLIKDELPELKGVENVLGEDNGSALLATVYGMDIIREKQPYSAELDLYENWNDYCGGKLETLAFEMLCLVRLSQSFSI
ncbi:hypothetical protein KKJ04_19450 [Xenorhabdus bovienii]|uniref:hypothetical protein n=1 Tax=Xenorhabdus bovienii TaxID=40576 RepID=UPI0023B2CB2A|nr:hypothetical protein [Xenorhabdus bovienii]MDE9447686.1 hypothetical protein [Xenorhabdus bovienii]